MDGSGCIHHVVDLVAARERPSIQKDDATAIPLQKVCNSLKHDLLAEVVLPRRIFNLLVREQCVPDFVLADYAPSSAESQFAGERTLASAGKAGHQRNRDWNE